MISESVKNWVTSLGIIFGGLWTWHQWNTIFPKTDAEIQISAASIRARVQGDVEILISRMHDGGEIQSANGQFVSEVCSDGSDKVIVRTPIRMALNLASSAPVPVKVIAEKFLFSELLFEPPELLVDGDPPVFQALSLQETQSFPLEDGVFVGGLRWTHIEPDGIGRIVMNGAVNLPFSCDFAGSHRTPAEFVFGFTIEIVALLPDGSEGKEVATREIFQSCQMNLDGGNNCPTRGLDGSTPQPTTNGTFGVFAQ